MANTLGIAQSALMAAQTGIATTGQNIANVGTPGYSRQATVQTAVSPVPMGFGYMGQGTQVTDIKRAYSDFLGMQRLTAQSSSSQLQIQYDQVQQLDNMLADPATGLSPAMQNFFNSMQDLSLTPGDVTARQAFLSGASALVATFHDLNGQLDSLNHGVNLQISDSVQNINDIAKQLGSLNLAIANSQGTGSKEANDLLDKRDQLLADLSKQVKVNVVKQANTEDVYIGNGQPLVVGANVYALKVISDDPGRLQVAYDINGQQATMTSNNLAGGQLGGILDFRSQILDQVRNGLDAIASGLGQGLNDINAQGKAPTGNNGAALFSFGSDPHAAGAIAMATNDLNQIATGNSSVVGDNSNVLKMLDLQTSKTLNGNSASFQQAYARIVSMVGSKTRELAITSASASSVLEQSNQAIQSVSGVNLDEEAANLMRYQQAYQAAGKLIQISKDMFDSLLRLE